MVLLRLILSLSIAATWFQLAGCDKNCELTDQVYCDAWVSQETGDVEDVLYIVDSCGKLARVQQ